MRTNRADLHRLLLAIREVGAGIERIRDTVTAAGKTIVEAIAENTKATEKVAEQSPPPPPSRLTVDVQIPQEETNRYYAQRNKPNVLQRLTFLVGVLSLIVLIWYA